MLNDLKYAFRWLRRSPGFAIVATLSLGLGVGVNTAMFSLVDGLLFRPLPVESPGTLADVFTSGGDGDEYATSSYPDFQDIKAQNTVFTDMIGYSPMLAPLALGERSRIVFGQIVTSNYFNLLGIQPSLGRLLVPADDEPGAERVVVLAHDMWVREFGSNPSVVGDTLTLRGLKYTIVGVSPASFSGVVPLLTPELWLPIAHVEEVEPAGINDAVPSPVGRTRLERRGMRWMFVKGRLRPGTTAEQANANIALIGRQLATANPQTNENRKMAAVATSKVRFLVPQAGGPLAIGGVGLMAIVGLVLLIACANVAGMLLARASARGREISVRLAIGASRRQLIRQLLIEGLALGSLGAATATAAAWLLIKLAVGLPLPVPVSLSLDLRLDARIFGFAIAIALGTGLLAALLPALKASAPSVVTDLRGGTASGRRNGRRWSLGDLLVVSQVALTAVLLIVAGLLLRSLGASERADVGFRSAGLALVSFDTDMVRYSRERGEQFWREALTRVRAMPGVTSAALATPTVPFEFNFNQQEMRVDSRSYPQGTRAEIVENIEITAGYLGTLGVSVLDGRDIAETDQRGTPDVAIVNQTMARRFWPDGSAVGHTFQVVSGGRTYRIVGVAADHKRHGVLEAPSPFVYFAAAQRPAAYNYIVARTNGDAAALVTAMRRELLQMEPGLVFMASRTMEAGFATSLVPARVGAWLATSFSALGTLLAAIGLYGVIAFSVARRTREIGLRMALGANPRGVLQLVMGQGAAFLGAGLLVGGAIAGGVAQLLSRLLFGVRPLDPAAWLLASLTLTLAAAAACYVPARRAMRVDPMVALRTE